MSLQQPPTCRASLTWALLLMALSGCGGGADEVPADSDLSFKSRAAQGTAVAVAAQPLSPAEVAEVQQRSRSWAVLSLLGAPAGANTVTLPPLYFGTAFSLAAAAAGDTLAELRQAFPAVSSPAVQAGLQRGLQRTVRAGESTVLGTAFLNSVTLTGWPGTLQALTLQPLNATQLAAEPNLRVSIEDRASATLGWNVMGSTEATWTSPQGGALAVTVLRVSAATRQLAGPGWVGQAMRMAGGSWLVKIEPAADVGSWGAAELDVALALAQGALGQVSAEADTVWELPQMALPGSGGGPDTRGMALAQDRVNANLRQLDGGGTYLQLPASEAPVLRLGPAGLSYEGSQRADYIFSPLNVSGQGSGFVSQRVEVATTVCPDTTLNLPAFFLALVHPGGPIALLARFNSFVGTPCIRVIGIGPG